MRILIVSNMNTKQLYGASTRPYYLGRALAQTQAVFNVGFDCSRLTNVPSLSVFAKSIPAYTRTINRAINEFRPDILYAHETFPGVAAYLSFRQNHLERPTVLVFDFHSVTAHEYKTIIQHNKRHLHIWPLFLKSYWPQRYIATRNQTIIAASQELKKTIIEWYRVPDHNIEVVPNGAPAEALNHGICPDNPYPKGVKTVLLVAPNTMLPNQLSIQFTLEVIDAVMASTTDPMIQFTVVGGGWDKNQIERYPTITYAGFVDNLSAYIDHADICLLPFPQSAVCGGARNKALEYFSRGKVVLTTPEGLRGLPDFKHEKHVFVSSYQPDEFARDLLLVLNNLEGFAYFGQNAREQIRKYHLWEHSANQVLSVFVHHYAAQR